MRLSRRPDRGAAAVETALVLPILLLIVFGIIDFGRMLNAQISLTEAAREGARAAALQATQEAVQDRVTAATRSVGGPGEVTIDWEESKLCETGSGPGDDAEVILNYDFSFITPVGALAGIFGGEGVGGDLTITGVGVMPCRA